MSGDYLAYGSGGQSPVPVSGGSPSRLEANHSRIYVQQIGTGTLSSRVTLGLSYQYHFTDAR